MRNRLAILLALVAVLAAGCGGDSEERSAETVPSTPELTVPGEDSPAEETVEEPTTTETAPAPTETTQPDEPSGGTTTPAPTTKDSPENDTPPPENSPASKFEKFCEENPGAC